MFNAKILSLSFYLKLQFIFRPKLNSYTAELMSIKFPSSKNENQIKLFQKMRIQSNYSRLVFILEFDKFCRWCCFCPEYLKIKFWQNKSMTRSFVLVSVCMLFVYSFVLSFDIPEMIKFKRFICLHSLNGL